MKFDPDNRNSIRLVERIGFRKEAHFVESLLMNGKWVDDLIYALIERDWEKLNDGELYPPLVRLLKALEQLAFACVKICFLSN